MSTSNVSQADTGGLGIRWYHLGFGLAFGLGDAVLPPGGVTTITGWVAGAAGSIVVALLVTVVTVGVVRAVDDWRPVTVRGVDVPDSRVKYAVFVALVLQLFVFGIGTSVNLDLNGMVLFTLPFNVLLAGTVAADVLQLRSRGVDLPTTTFGYAVAAIVLGFVAGLLYWRRRGRARTGAAPADTTEQDDTDGDDAATETAVDEATTGGDTADSGGEQS